MLTAPATNCPLPFVSSRGDALLTEKDESCQVAMPCFVRRFADRVPARLVPISWLDKP